MYLQRLKKAKDKNNEDSLNYQVMGYNEFENGVTKTSRTQLAQYWKDNDIAIIRTQLIAYHGKVKEEINATILSNKEVISKVKNPLHIESYKTFMRTDDEENFAWMSVGGEETIFIMRTQDEKECLKRLELFLKPAVEYLDSLSVEEEVSLKI